MSRSSKTRPANIHGRRNPVVGSKAKPMAGPLGHLMRAFRVPVLAGVVVGGGTILADVIIKANNSDDLNQGSSWTGE